MVMSVFLDMYFVHFAIEDSHVGMFSCFRGKESRSLDLKKSKVTHIKIGITGLFASFCTCFFL